MRHSNANHMSYQLSASKRNHLHRLRFYGIDSDRLETIVRALSVARNDLGTEYDSVALEAICQHFLATYIPDPQRLPAKQIPQCDETQNAINCTETTQKICN